jgi:hypothetical protein
MYKGRRITRLAGDAAIAALYRGSIWLCEVSWSERLNAKAAARLKPTVSHTVSLDLESLEKNIGEDRWMFGAYIF